MPPQPEEKFSGWTDREILGLDQDRLKFYHYAGVLAGIIREADTPLTLGVFGPWGSGKTSLLRLVKDTLDKARAAAFKTLWFDAWTFDKEDALWRALILLVLKTVRKEIPAEDGDALKTLNDLEASLYCDVDREEAGGVSVDWERAATGTVSGLTRLTLSLVPGVGSFLAKTAEEAQKQLSGGTLDSLFDVVQRERRKLHREHVESLEQFQLGFAELLRKHFLPDKRLVVFVDDLDRCLPEKAIGVLEAIKLFLDAPGCVYVVGADRDVIEQGIRVKYKDFFVGEGASTPITGDQYLEKIIQIPFNMPPLQEGRIEEFIAQYDQAVPPACARILAAGIEPNPRKVKRTINVFRLLNKLAETRVAEKEIDQFDPGLLAKIVVIQSRWRRLYADLLEYPNLVQDLERHFRAEEAKTEAAEATPKRGEPADAERQADAPQPKTERQTLLDKYTGAKALGRMLRLPPYFEALKIDQIQLYLYLTHTVEAEAATEEESLQDADTRRWDDLLSNDLTRIRATAEAVERDGQNRGYARRLVQAQADERTLSTIQRVSALTSAGYLGDPRFREDAWYLPDDPLLGFIEIPAGPFVMGSDPKRDKQADADEQPQHEVPLPACYIARHPVTVAQFRAFVQSSGYNVRDKEALEGSPNHPVARVTWHDAIAYCGWPTEQLRQGKDASDALTRLLRDGKGRITLPSEAEWEKAARGGKQLPDGSANPNPGRIYPWGDEVDPSRLNARETGLGATSAAGSFPGGASPYGVLDLSGNVWEWTRSLWGKNLEKPDFTYPYNPYDRSREDQKAPDDVLRVVRGGAFDNGQGDARCACRPRLSPGYRSGGIGIRVVVSPL